MPIAEARYDFRIQVGKQMHDFRVVMHEERELDAAGMPGRLISAKLATYHVDPPGPKVSYKRLSLAGQSRFYLLVDNQPKQIPRPERVWLRWLGDQ
ncbi:MAG: hypothetical protein JST65_00920 [Acidobacteria bacterium]|nr:hypothetical protein [Acidobacteriota bacterium]